MRARHARHALSKRLSSSAIKEVDGDALVFPNIRRLERAIEILGEVDFSAVVRRIARQNSRHGEFVRRGVIANDGSVYDQGEECLLCSRIACTEESVTVEVADGRV